MTNFWSFFTFRIFFGYGFSHKINFPWPPNLGEPWAKQDLSEIIIILFIVDSWRKMLNFFVTLIKTILRIFSLLVIALMKNINKTKTKDAGGMQMSISQLDPQCLYILLPFLLVEKIVKRTINNIYFLLTGPWIGACKKIKSVNL